MKIVMFQYNRAASAIIRCNTMGQEDSPESKKMKTNCFLAGGYTDRLLWEEAASLRPKKQENYIILSNWH